MQVPSAATPPKPLPEIFPTGVTLRDPEDNETLRGNIFNTVKSEMARVFPQEFGGVRVEVKDVDYEGPERVTLKEQGKAIMENGYLARRLRGRIELYDTNTGELLDQKHMTLARVPYLTERGTFIHSGSEYAPILQSRLMPGVYSRVQNNGVLESQFNVRPGTGSRFRVAMEPESAQYRFRVKTSDLHLYSLLHDIGIPDEDLEAAWGKDILDMNRVKYDARTLDKAYNQFVPRRLQDPAADAEKKRQALRVAFDAAQVHKGVMNVNLPEFDGIKRSAALPDVGTANPAARSFYAGLNWVVKRASFTADEIQTLALFLNTHLNAGLDPNLPGEMLREQIMNFVLADGAGGDSQALLTAAQASMPAPVNTPATDQPDLTKFARVMIAVGLCKNHPDEFSMVKQASGRIIRHQSGREIHISAQDFIPGELHP